MVNYDDRLTPMNCAWNQSPREMFPLVPEIAWWIWFTGKIIYIVIYQNYRISKITDFDSFDFDLASTLQPISPLQQNSSHICRHLNIALISFWQMKIDMTCIFLGSPCVSILLARLTVFPQISYWGFCAPITPATKGPTLIPVFSFSNESLSLSLLPIRNSKFWNESRLSWSRICDIARANSMRTDALRNAYKHLQCVVKS